MVRNNINKDLIDKCIQNAKQGEEKVSLITKDYDLYQYNRIYNYPSLYINDIKYKVIVMNIINIIIYASLLKYNFNNPNLTYIGILVQ